MHKRDLRSNWVYFNLIILDEILILMKVNLSKTTQPELISVDIKGIRFKKKTKLLTDIKSTV